MSAFPGVFGRLVAAVSVIITWSASARAGPPGDYGDAPVGNAADNVSAYAGVLARWPTAFAHKDTVYLPWHPQGAWLNPGASVRLGTVGPSVKVDSSMSPASPENDAAPVILIWTNPPSPGPNPLASLEVTVTTSAGHDPDQPVYLNVWIDQNRDGQWKDGFFGAAPLAAWNHEWAAEDVPLWLPAGATARVAISPIRLEDPLNSHWLRAMVSDEPVGAAFRGPYGSPSGLWDSTMPAAHAFKGEIEDHLLTFRTDDPGPVPSTGIWYYQQYKRRNPPGGGAPPKPSCTLTYLGPWLVYPPVCPAQLVTTLGYSSISVAGGCARAPALWGMYGLKWIAGILAPPAVGLRFPLPAGAIIGIGAMACPPPAAVLLTLPAAFLNEGPAMANLQIPVAALTRPSLRIQSCYAVPPRRFRVYRAFFHHNTCGSLHLNRTVHTQPAGGMTLSAATVDGPGQSADYCDFAIGGLEEDFIDTVESRPYPDPDFTNITISPFTPTGGAGLTTSTFVSPPASLRIQSAAYLVSPALPEGWTPSRVRLWHKGGDAQLVFTGAEGAVLTATLAPSADWTAFEMPIAPEIRLQSIALSVSGQILIDNLTLDLVQSRRPAVVVPVSWTSEAVVGADAFFDVEFFSPGSQPFDPDPWDLWRGVDMPMFVSDEDAQSLWQPLTDGMILPSGTRVHITPSGDLSLTGLAAGDAINREFRVRARITAGTFSDTTYGLTVRIVGCNLADITEIGGLTEAPGVPDNQLTVDDVILFINLFADSSGCPGDDAPCSLADVCGIGGPPEEPDGQLTVDDIIAFINAFSDGC